jgi:hypothetical protein
VDAFIISYAKDTNGQNARYVAASRRVGADVIRNAFAIGSSDPAGVVGRFQLAAEKYGDLRIRSAHRVTYDDFRYPTDIEWTPTTEPQIKQLIAKADVVHLNNSFKAMQRFGMHKPMLLHHHGTLFRNNSASMLALAKYHKVAQAVSTPDLLRFDTDVLRWLPSAYDIDELQRIGRANRREPDDRIRIVHAPTQGGIYKNTPAFLAAVEQLQQDGYPLDLVMVQGMTNAECLVEKAKADIVYDQMTFGYGCNSIEAWGLGVPVVAGADEWTLAKMREMWGRLPFAEATEQTLYDVLKGLIKSRDMRDEYAERGLVHVRQYHDECPALATLLELYEEAIGNRLRPRIKGKAATFDYTGGQTMRVDGQQLDFSKGPITVDDTVVVNKLRKMIRHRPAFGVKEIA